MSNFLLQKSFKLFQDSKQTKNKGKKTSLHKIKKKRNWVAVRKNKEKELEQNLLDNLEIIKRLHRKDFTHVPEEVVKHCSAPSKSDQDSDVDVREESTVFTEKDFEEFEKEYFDS